MRKVKKIFSGCSILLFWHKQAPNVNKAQSFCFLLEEAPQRAHVTFADLNFLFLTHLAESLNLNQRLQFNQLV